MAGVAELTRFALAVTIVFYSIGVVFSLVKANLSYMSGGPEKYSDALEKIVIMSILLAAAFLVQRGGEGSLGISWSVSEDGNAPVWKQMAKVIIAIVVGTGYFFIAVRAVWTIFLGQAGHMTGRPFQMSTALLRLGGVLIGGVLTVFAVRITQGLLDSISAIAG
jgi:hypothetical protein